MMILIIDYGLCNIRSVEKALDRINSEYMTSSDPKDFDLATHFILPGVGSFPDGMTNLKKLGLIEPLKTQVLKNKKPLLGICLGMQLLADRGEENNVCEGLGLIPGVVKKLQTKRDVKLPHMGWNNIKHNKSILFDNITQDTNFYFLNSFHFIPISESVISSKCSYGGEFVSSIQNQNIFGTQFHPEKSQKYGLELLKNFVNYNVKN